MNWDAIGAVGEILGALAVVFTLIYVAAQVTYAKNSMADQNRLERTRGVKDMAILVCANDELRYDQIKSWGLTDYYEALGEKEGISPERASGVDWCNTYYFWMYWGQYASTTSEEDLLELENVLSGLLNLPGMRYTWETSPMNRPLLEPKFVKFVDEILAKKLVQVPPNKAIEADA